MADNSDLPPGEMTRHHIRWAQGRATSRGVPANAGLNFEKHYNKALPRLGGGSGMFIQPGGRHTPTKRDRR